MTFKTFSAKLELIPESHSVGEEDVGEVVGLVLEDESLDGDHPSFQAYYGPAIPTQSCVESSYGGIYPKIFNAFWCFSLILARCSAFSVSFSSFALL